MTFDQFKALQAKITVAVAIACGVLVAAGLLYAIYATFEQ